MRLIYNPSRGWFRDWSMLTGSKDYRTGAWFPTIVRGRALPPVMKYKVGPYATAAEAMANAA